MFHDVYQAVCSKRRSRARPSHRHPPEGERVGARGERRVCRERKQEVNEWASANRGLMGVWIDGSSDGCVGGFSPNWRCKRVAAAHITSEKYRDLPCSSRESKSAWWILLVGMTRFHGRWPNAGSKDEGMHAWSVCTFQGDSQRVGEVGSLRGCVDSGGVIRGVKS